MAGTAEASRVGTVGPFRPVRPLMVPVAVSREKLQDELSQWVKNSALYRQRGWILLGVDDLWVELAVLQRVGNTGWPVVGACVGLDYRNYDLEPPSLTFIDPWTRLPADPPFKPHQLEGKQVRPLVPAAHPTTKRPFLCLPGILEYHVHPEHDGDSWLAGHRALGEGRLANVANHLWATTRIAFAPQVEVKAGFAPVVDAVPASAAVDKTPDRVNEEQQGAVSDTSAGRASYGNA